MEEEINLDVDPRIRVMEIFQEFFYESNRGGITCLKGADDREFCIKFYSKENFFRDCYRLQASLHGQA